MAKAAARGAKLAVMYGPQAKIAWDKGGKQATHAAAKRALTLNARRKALAHAAGVVDGSILKIAPTGSTVYVVFTGEKPIATYPPQDTPLPVLLAHADYDKRVRPDDVRRRSAKPRRPKMLGGGGAA
jgi:hypothetical protein